MTDDEKKEVADKVTEANKDPVLYCSCYHVVSSNCFMFMLQMNCYHVTFIGTIFWEGVIRWISCYFLIILWYFWGNLYSFSCL
ncbi:hypothetical protein, partial [Ligilactobacillus sp. UO.C109]|uniref:hypothetical protein n=1 Tax=Ligilactobacillus sp. UO.C109 TaxID=3003264 RepID=UPI003FA5EDA1